MNMPKWKKKDKRSDLDKEIEKLEEMIRNASDPTSEYYRELTKSLDILLELRSKKKPVKEIRQLDPNTVAVIIGGIAEVVLIMSYENLHVITTKAWSRILRPRV